LYDIFNVLLDEKDQVMCESCQFLYDKAERKEPEPDDEIKAMELEGMKMRQEEYEKNMKMSYKFLALLALSQISSMVMAVSHFRKIPVK